MNDSKATCRYLSIADAAAETGISVGLLRKWIRRGDVPASRAGRRVVLRLADVQSLLRPYTPTTYRQGAFLRTDTAKLVDRAVVEYVRQFGYDDPPPPR